MVRNPERIRLELKHKNKTAFLELVRMNEDEYGTPFKWNSGWYLHKLYVPESIRGLGIAEGLMWRFQYLVQGMRINVALYARGFKKDGSRDRSIDINRLRKFYRRHGFKTKRTKIERNLWMVRQWHPR